MDSSIVDDLRPRGILRHGFLHRSSAYADSRRQCMSVLVCCSLAHVEQGRSTCNVSRSLSVELFCFAACVCHVCLFRFLARSLTSSKDDRPAMSIALSVELFCFAACACQCTSNRREFCCSLANSLAKLIASQRENRSKIDPRRHLGAPKIE